MIHQKQNSVGDKTQQNNISIDNILKNQSKAYHRQIYLHLEYPNCQKKPFNFKIIVDITKMLLQLNLKSLLIRSTGSINYKLNQSKTQVKKTWVNGLQNMINLEKDQKLKEIKIKANSLIIENSSLINLIYKVKVKKNYKKVNQAIY